jgi:hypothetical protein
MFIVVSCRCRYLSMPDVFCYAVLVHRVWAAPKAYTDESLGVSQDTTSSIVGNTNLWLANTSRKAMLKAWKTGTGLGVLVPILARACANSAVLSMRVTETCFAAAALPGNCNHSSGGASSCWTCKANERQTNKQTHTTTQPSTHTRPHNQTHTTAHIHQTTYDRTHMTTQRSYPTSTALHDHSTRGWEGLLCGRMCAVVCVYVFGCGRMCRVVWSWVFVCGALVVGCLVVVHAIFGCSCRPGVLGP